MREAGFEPAHPEIVGLKSTALDHSAIRAKSSLSFNPFFSFVLYFPIIHLFILIPPLNHFQLHLISFIFVLVLLFSVLFWFYYTGKQNHQRSQNDFSSTTNHLSLPPYIPNIISLYQNTHNTIY